MAVDIPDLLKIAASSSIFSAVTTWGLNHYFVNRASFKRDAKYTALRIALILERFAFDCAEALSDHEASNQSDGFAGKELSGVPELRDFPSDADWKVLHTDLTNRALTLPISLIQATSAIDFWCKIVGDDDCMKVEAGHQTGFMGLTAWQLAVDLRRRYDIPEFQQERGQSNFLSVLLVFNDAKLRSDAAKSR